MGQPGRIWPLTMIALFLVSICGLSLICLLDVLTFDWTHPLEQSNLQCKHNGLWLRYWWYAGQRSSVQQSEMLEHLGDLRVTYSFFHVMGIRSDGSLELHKEQSARALISAVHAASSDTKVIAWIYVPAWPAKNGVRLEDENVRAKMVDESLWLVNHCGFDGVQWDYEFAADKHPGLPLLIRETRKAMPQKFVGVATPMWYPGTLWGWSDQYFAQIASASDQVAIMAYDSWSPSPSLYAWLVHEQVLHAAKAVSGTNCTVMLGVPTYKNQTAAHHAWAENLNTALKGAIAGYDKLTIDQRSRFDGIAPFADYTTDSSEWKLLSTLTAQPQTKSTQPISPE